MKIKWAHFVKASEREKEREEKMRHTHDDDDDDMMNACERVSKCLLICQHSSIDYGSSYQSTQYKNTYLEIKVKASSSLKYEIEKKIIENENRSSKLSSLSVSMKVKRLFTNACHFFLLSCVYFMFAWQRQSFGWKIVYAQFVTLIFNSYCMTSSRSQLERLERTMERVKRLTQIDDVSEVNEANTQFLSSNQGPY